MNEFESLRDRLYETAVPMPGIAMSQAQARERVNVSRQNCMSIHFIVGDWLWIDLNSLPDRAHKQLQASGQQPVVLISRLVMYSSDQGRGEGNWMLTTLLESFTDGFFKTRNSHILLFGNGLRTSTDLQTLLKLLPAGYSND